jgi:hypothetical protein
MLTNRMICIHRSAAHKNSKRKKKNDDNDINKTKIQKTDDITSSMENDVIETNIITTVTTNETNKEKIINNRIRIIKEINENFFNNEVTDNIQQYSQFEYDVTIGSSAGGEYSLEKNTIFDNNIDIGNNDETTVTEVSINNDNNNMILNKIIPTTLFKVIDDSKKIKSMVSICFFVLLLFEFT